jgi:hypothetical protein
MGLDMFAYARKGEVDAEADFKTEEDDHEVHYWRKHPNLHGWMQELYRSKGGEDENFNCSQVKLTLEDLDELEVAIKTDDLPETAGFFFGQSYSDEDEKNDDLEFIEKAREYINDGYTVYYTSWW